jgi:hypothetical protein
MMDHLVSREQLRSMLSSGRNSITIPSSSIAPDGGTGTIMTGNNSSTVSNDPEKQ